jgi:hypothetical protein
MFAFYSRTLVALKKEQKFAIAEIKKTNNIPARVFRILIIQISYIRLLNRYFVLINKSAVSIYYSPKQLKPA